MRIQLFAMIGLALLILACAGGGPEPGSPGATETPAESFRSPPAELLYKASSKGEAERSEWAPGDRLYLGVDQANLRESPSPDAPVVAVLPMGAELIVQETSSDVTTLLERTNRWYRVRSGGIEGHMFGSLLTPLLLRGNLDGDDGDEMISVTFAPDFRVRLRVMEPTMSEEDDRTVGLDLKMPGLLRGGVVTAQVLPSPHDRWSLLLVRLCDGKTCKERLASYLHEELRLGQLAEIEGEPSKLAFVEGGFTLGGSETYKPVRSVFTTCPDCVRQMTYTREKSQEVYTATLSSGDRGPDSVVKCKRIGALNDYPYKGMGLVSCTVWWPGQWDHSTAPDSMDIYRFVMASSYRWVLLPRVSNQYNWLPSIIERLGKDKGIKVDIDKEAVIRGLARPPVLKEGPWGKIVLYYSAAGVWDRSNLEVVFTDPVVGPVYGEVKFEGQAASALLVPQPEGATLVYSYELPAWTRLDLVALEQDPRKGREYSPFVPDYDTYSSVEIDLVSLPDAELQLFATTETGDPLYMLASEDHPLHHAAYLEYAAKQQRPLLSQAEFVASFPQFFWRDPFGRLVRFLRKDLRPPEGNPGEYDFDRHAGSLPR